MSALPSGPGGKLPRQDTQDTIIRDLQRRIKLLEDQLARVISGVTPTLDRPAIFTLTTPSTSFTIIHGKNRFVVAKTYDTSGVEFECEVSCPTPNTVVLSGQEAFSGTAVII